MEDCLKLLKGERDEQKLAGLLLATKFYKGEDQASIQKLYEAVGSQFLDRLFKTGLGIAAATGKEDDDRDAYLQLSVTLLAAFTRVPEIAQSQDMVSKVPHILNILKTQLQYPSSIVDECYEFIFQVSTSKDGVTTLYNFGGISVVATNMSTLPDGSHTFELAMKLVQSMLTNLPKLEDMYNEYPSELSHMVVVIAQQFYLSQNALKFKALDVLSLLLSSNYAAPLHDALRLISNGIWPRYLRDGVATILQNRVASDIKFQALVLAESLMSTLGEKWLVEEGTLPLLLVMECSRVEVAVLLNELAYLKFEASDHNSSVQLKQRNLGIVFSLIEKIIKLISDASEGNGGHDHVDEDTIVKMITRLNETIGLVLEFLQDAKEHEQRKGDDLLAAVRIVGSYLAEAPLACKEKIHGLLEYILTVEGEDEPSPCSSTSFMLPFLCQISKDGE